VGIVAASFAAQTPSNATSGPSRQYNGKWWVNADAPERAGFINGAGDCLTWTAHVDGFNAPPESIAGEIGKYYESHPEAAGSSVVDVWRKVAAKQRVAPASKSGDGEDWANAHWYLNGDWWGGGGLPEKQGFLEGYLWCMSNRVNPKTETYSRTVGFYQKKIDAYIDAHPKAGNEAIADILHRFRDKSVQVAPQ